MKKIFIVLIMLITSLVAKPIDGDINNTNEDVTQNLISEQVTSNEDHKIAEEVEQIDEKQKVLLKIKLKRRSQKVILLKQLLFKNNQL